MHLLWAQALGLAAWWLLWAGFGQSALTSRRLSPRLLLYVLGVTWGLGWIALPLGPGAHPLNMGLAVLGVLALGWGYGHGSPGWWIGWLALGVLATWARGLAPINGQHASLVPWLGPEAIALGLLAAVVGMEPVGGAVIAIGAAMVANVWRAWTVLPSHGGLGASDWLYVVTAVLVAWIVGQALSGSPWLKNRYE